MARRPLPDEPSTRQQWLEAFRWHTKRRIAYMLALTSPVVFALGVFTGNVYKILPASWLPIIEMSEEEYYNRLKTCIQTLAEPKLSWQTAEVIKLGDYRFLVSLKNYSRELSLQIPGSRERLSFELVIARKVSDRNSIQVDAFSRDARQVAWKDDDQSDPSALYDSFKPAQLSALSAYSLRLTNYVSDCLQKKSPPGPPAAVARPS